MSATHEDPCKQWILAIFEQERKRMKEERKRMKEERTRKGILEKLQVVSKRGQWPVLGKRGHNLKYGGVRYRNISWGKVRRWVVREKVVMEKRYLSGVCSVVQLKRMRTTQKKEEEWDEGGKLKLYQQNSKVFWKKMN